MASWLVAAPCGSQTAPMEPWRPPRRRGLDRFAAHRGVQALGDQRHFALAAFAQDDAEFVAGRASDDVGDAQRLGEPLPGLHDHSSATSNP
jgi:hypothetical protein